MGRVVKIIADTNVLVRALVRDDPAQASQAMEVREITLLRQHPR